VRGRFAVVTGPASRLGLATANRFADEGMKVVSADVQGDALAAAETAIQGRGVGVLAVRTDVTSRDAVDAAFANVPVVFNNAGVAATAATLRPRAWKGALADWD
jgi:3-oxoacyl-[acyl-carrier protein] reductase